MGEARARRVAGEADRITLFLTPVCTAAVQAQGRAWDVSSAGAVARLLHLGLDDVEAEQARRGETLPALPEGWTMPEPPQNLSVPNGCLAVRVPLRPETAQRLRLVAIREDAWRHGGFDYAKRPPTVGLYGASGWALYRGLITVGQFSASGTARVAAASPIPIAQGLGG